jgi:GntR family transcriptional regulator/MocR family aminotransferase
MHLELDGTGALYEQLTRALKRGIIGGHLRGGSKLPATRDLANDLRVSRNTVLTAYDLLCTEQLAIPRGGSGTYVAHNMGPERRRARVTQSGRSHATPRGLDNWGPPISLARNHRCDTTCIAVSRS